MWAREYACCTACGTTKRKHNGKGLCGNCSNKAKYHKNPTPWRERRKENYYANRDQRIAYSREYYYQHHQENLSKMRIAREKKWFGGNREKCLKRDTYLCKNCGKPAEIVHHKDGIGRGHSAPNNSLRNLVSLCRACHVNVHKPRKKI